MRTIGVIRPQVISEGPWYFDTTVQRDYSHENQLKRFFRESKCRKELNGNPKEIFNPDTWARTTDELKAGHSYRFSLLQVPMIQGRRVAGGTQSLSFLKRNGFLLVGAQGLTFFLETFWEKIPDNYFIVAYDEMERCPIDERARPLVAIYNRNKISGHDLFCAIFDGIRNSSSLLLAVRPING